MLHLGDHDLVAGAEGLPDAETDEADERRRVQAEADLGRVRGVKPQGHAFARLLHGGIDPPALRVSPAALHVVRDEVIRDGVEHALRDLSSRSIIEEHEIARAGQGRKGRAKIGDGEVCLRFVHRDAPGLRGCRAVKA